LKDYLVLLSIFQTCKYKGVSFLMVVGAQNGPTSGARMAK